MKRKAAILFLVAGIILLIAGLSWYFLAARSLPSREVKVDLGLAPASTQVSGPKIKVAVYLSEYCASGADGTQWAYGHSCQIVSGLHNSELQLTPIIEPGTESAPDLAKVLHDYFPSEKFADATNPVVLKSFDVLVIPRINYIRAEQLDAIEQAVKSGVGLFIRNTFASGIPGYTTQAAQMNGFGACDFNYADKPVDCVVLGDDPLLGSLHKGDKIRMTPNGAYGVPMAGAVPLIAVIDPHKLVFPLDAPSWRFCPLMTFQLGKGRGVQCAFPAWQAVPADLQRGTANQFNIRAIEWLAHRL